MKIKEIIKKLELKQKLTKEEIETLINNYCNNKITNEQMTTFLQLVCKNGLTYDEIIYLTDAMIKSGEIVDLSKVNKTIVDKHSTGGVGDKVSLIVAPIIASLGLAMAKMSGRSLGYTGGTIDKLESIPGYKVDLEEKDFIDMLNKVGMTIISQTKNIAPADKKIYALRDATNTVESIALIASSIMSKKIASGSDIIVIDLKVGKGAFMKDIKKAKLLAKTMIKIAENYNKKLICILTDMNSPLGYNVGNALEVKEVIEYFDGKREKRLDEVVKTISSYLVSLGKNISLKQAQKEVEETLNNGLAKAKFYEWIENQNGKIKKLKIDAKKINILSKESGYIKSIDALNIGKLARKLGAGRVKLNEKIDYNVGITFNKTVGSEVKEKDVIATIYYNKKIKNIEEEFLKNIEISSLKPKDKVILKIIK